MDRVDAAGLELGEYFLGPIAVLQTVDDHRADAVGRSIGHRHANFR
jgi:hypothetical protein